LGLQQSIADELQILQNTGQFATHLKIIGEAYKLLPQKEMVLFRIVQEALNNCIKYSKAKNITVTLNYDTANFLLHITDDGIGFDTHVKTGIGLKSMQNRAALISGEFSIQSSPGNGTAIIITLLKEARTANQ
ncbi:MAG: ATP-binding protein, partial [Ferruginibacter sp.]